MRIVCQKCAAAYAIDDRLITAKGVRAQCPRCRHLQLVKREASAASVTASPPEGAAPAAPEPKRPPAAPAPPVAREPRSNPAAAKAPEASDLFGDLGSMPELGPPRDADPFADLGPQASSPSRSEPAAKSAPPPARKEPAAKPAPPPPAGPAPSLALPADPLLDFLGPPPSDLGRDGASPVAASASSAGGVSLGRMSARAPAAAPAKAETHANCRSCGKVLADPFDQALGVCDDCRQRDPMGSSEASVVVAPQALDTSSGGDLELPMMSNLDPSKASSGGDLDLAGGSQASGEDLRLAGATALSPDARISSVKPARTSHITAAPVRTAQRTGAGGGSRSLAAGLLVVVLLGGGAAAGYFLLYKPWQEKAARAALPAAPTTIPPAVMAAVSNWKLQFLELMGTSQDHLAAGQQQLAKDQRVAYAEAEESFQQALLLDPRSTDAIAGYVQALALGRGPGMDDATFEEARGLIRAAEDMAGRTPALLVAHANLLLSRSRVAGNLEEASILAKAVLAQPTALDAHKAEAHLVLGRAQVATSRELANKAFDEARQLAPGLKRVDYYSALAHEQAGQYGLALKMLGRRLELDPQDWDSLEASARIYVEVGETGRARKLYEDRVKANAGDVRASIALAVLRYQAEDDARLAVRELRALAKNVSRYGPREASEIWGHLAAAERTAGNADGAVKAADEALKVMKDLPEAHLQLFLVALARKDAAKARGHLKGFQGRLEDSALEQVLVGRVLLLEQNAVAAQEHFLKAGVLDDRRLDSQLLAGVAVASTKQREEAFRLFFGVLEARKWDPMRLAPRPALTRFWLRPGDTLAGVEGVVQALSSRPDDVQPVLYEGLVRYYQGDLPGADRLFRAVVDTGVNNGGALAYRSLIALDAKSAQALPLAEKAVALERSLPMALLSLGLAQAEAGDVELAKRTVGSVLRLSPTMLSAQTHLAELEVAAQPEVARAMLLKVVGLDPAYFPAKALLFKLDKRG
ncbi:zinc-ribbon domain-containing protein [Corallococcus terminator]|uniref:Gliding motility protein n=1 Tax=Corallococcus terminator TaxID=2316733 RepID=A0A3A8I8G1_9BACT|nr:zinc-ribbon domain-containing protein [Corallococcus terminator]RKG79552.1 gliding motility protein [Corallococcus terminator]